MQSLAAPIGGGEERHFDLFELDHARAIEVVDQAAPRDLAGRVGVVLGALLRGQIAQARHRLAGDLAHRALVADAVLYAQDLARVPALGEAAEDAAVAGELAVI